MSEDVREKGGKGKTPMPWFKMFPIAWLKDTRDLTREQRSVYFDCLCVIYRDDRPLPKNDAWIAHEIHENVRVWRRVRDVLLARGMLIEVPEGYANKRANIELEARMSAHSKRTHSANERQLIRRIAPELPFENKGRPPKLTVVTGPTSTTDDPTRARAQSDHQIIEEEKKESLSCDAPLIDDDPHRRRRELSPGILASLRAKYGGEEINHALLVYFRSEFAKNARHIDSAFPAWVDSLPRDEQSPKDVASAIVELCRRPDGTLDTALPKKVRDVPPPNRRRA